MNHQLNIADLFFGAAEKFPDKTAIIYNGDEITFAALKKEVQDTAVYFISKGISKGDRVLVFVPMSIDLYRIILALFSIGATAVFLDEWVNKKRMEECCRIADCKGFIGIFKARVFAYFSGELRKIPIKLGTSYKRSKEAVPVQILTAPTDTALITFTTGSTGTPKAAKRTHGFLLEQFNVLTDKMQPQVHDIDMPVLPIVLLVNLGTGNTSVIADFKASKPNTLQPGKILKQLIKHDVNRITASPFFIESLAKYLSRKQSPLNSIEKIFTGGAPVFPAEAEWYIKAFPKAYIEIIYGSTEAEPISSINATELIKEKDEIIKKGLKVGKPYRKTAVKIINITDEPVFAQDEQQFKELELSVNSVGEIIVSGPHVLKEYFNNENAFARNKILVKDQCWHRTGDSGYLNEEGVLYLMGRCNIITDYKGKLISPFIHENILKNIAGVEAGTVLKLKGKLIVIIELKSGIAKEQIIQHINETEIIFEEIQFVKKISRDLRHNSKIDYEKLKASLT